MSCNKCNNTTTAYNPCNCTPYEACITEPLVPACDDPEFCDELFSDKCIVHNGPTLSNIGAVEGVRLNTILTNIDTKLIPLTAEDLIVLINSSDALKATIIALLNPA